MKKIAMLLLCCLLLTACGSKKDQADTNTGATTKATVSVEENTIPTEESAETTEAAASILKVYSPDDALESFVVTEVTVETIDEQAIVRQLIAANVLTEDTEANVLELDGTHVTVDFNTAFRDLILSQGSTGEWAVMGSVVNTFLTAYNADTMTITVNGEVLESGHVIYDEPLTFFE